LGWSSRSADVWRTPKPGRVLGIRRTEGSEMIAALNMGLVGTIIVIAIVVALVLFFLRRA